MVNSENLRVQKLRGAGFKLTNARLTVLRVLEERGGHLTSAEVLEAVAKEDTNIGRASVFRTLDLFTRLAVIRPTYIDSSTTPTYVLMPDGHHHHIICVNCNRVMEFDDCGLASLTQQLQDEFDMTITGHLLEFYGRCSDCQLETDDE